MAEFEEAFPIEANEEDPENKEKKKRVYWRDIIEAEE